MSLSNVPKTGVDGTIKLIDGTSVTPLDLTLRFYMGDWNLTGLVPGGRESVVIEGRGKTRGLRKGKVKFPTVSLSAHAAELTETGTGTLLDWVYKTTGTPFASRAKTHSIGDLDTTNIQLTIEGTDHGDGADHVVWLGDVSFEVTHQQGEDGDKFSIQGTVYGNIKLNGTTVHTAPRET